MFLLLSNRVSIMRHPKRLSSSDYIPPQFTVNANRWEDLKPFGREMRHEPTPAEEALWQRLRGRRLNQAKFRRQHAIASFIVDFVCIEARLIVEVDGIIHESPDHQAYDESRQRMLENMGYQLLRFSYGEVLQQMEGVLAAIGATLDEGRGKLEGEKHGLP